MWIIHILIFNLTFVFLTELPLGFILGAKTLKKLITVALSNVITNPLVVLSSLCMTLFLGKRFLIVLLILELSAFLAEGFIFSKCKIFEDKNPYLISFLLNLTSFISGEIINIIF